MAAKSFVYVLFVTIGALVSCSTTTDFPTRFRGEQIHFGQGGGFSGILNYYVLLDDGRLYQRALQDSTFAFSDTWEKPFVRQMFFNYSLLDLEKVDFFEPGDRYYFIQHKSKNDPFHNITWGKPGTKPDQNIVTFYNLLYKSTKSTL